MAKTKGSQKKLRDAVVGLAGTCSSTEPPPKRIRTKTKDSQEPAVPEMPKQSTVASEVKEHGGDPNTHPLVTLHAILQFRLALLRLVGTIFKPFKIITG